MRASKAVFSAFASFHSSSLISVRNTHQSVATKIPVNKNRAHLPYFLLCFRYFERVDAVQPTNKNRRRFARYSNLVFYKGGRMGGRMLHPTGQIVFSIGLSHHGMNSIFRKRYYQAFKSECLNTWFRLERPMVRALRTEERLPL